MDETIKDVQVPEGASIKKPKLNLSKTVVKTVKHVPSNKKNLKLSLSKSNCKKINVVKKQQNHGIHILSPSRIPQICVDHLDNSNSDVEVLEHVKPCVLPSLMVEEKFTNSPSRKSHEQFDLKTTPPQSPSIKQINSNVNTPPKSAFKLSKSVSQSPNKYVINDGSNISMSPKSLNKSPSKKLIKHSPIRFLKKSPVKNKLGSPSSSSPYRKLQFGNLVSNNSSQQNPDINKVTLDHINAAHFSTVLQEVLLYLNDSNIFNELELKIVNDFIEMPRQNKELYVRMFGRKSGWHRVSNIRYENISNDLFTVFKSLEQSCFVTFDYSSEKPATLLNLLQVAELKLLCKGLNIKVTSKSNKPALMQYLLDFVGCQKTLNFFKCSSSASVLNTSSNILMNKLKGILNDCIMFSSEPRKIFRRMFLLFSLFKTSTDEEQEDVSQYLLLMHMVNIGKMVFPTYHMTRYPVFETRDQFLAFEQAHELESLLLETIERKDWISIPNLTSCALESFSNILKDDILIDHDQKLPMFLRKFTSGSTYAYILTVGAEAMKKEPTLAPKVIAILRKLLSQTIYLEKYRGRWYEQLALVYQHKLNDNTEAAEVVCAGLSDDLVTEVWRHTLADRGTMLVGRKTGKPDATVKQKLVDILVNKEPLQEPPSIKIVSKALENKPGFKKVYILVDFEKQETTYSSVEEFALSHYRSLGFTEGVHCEGSLVVSLFGLFFWDIIYEVPVYGAFQSAYQSRPLDLSSLEFYTNRKEAVDKRLDEMEQWSIDEIQLYIEQMFADHRDKISVVNWERLQSSCRVIEIVNCIRMPILGKICFRLVKQFRNASSGFPDLVIWNSELSKCKFVEVKGKGDHLSVKQRVWLDYLKKIGADAEVCHVHHS